MLLVLFIVRPVVDIDVTDADPGSQVYSPCCCVFAIIVNCTLTSNI